MIETSSDLSRSSSAIFVNIQKMFGNIRLVSETSLEYLRKVVRNIRKSSKTSSLLYLYDKQHNTYFIFFWTKRCFFSSISAVLKQDFPDWLQLPEYVDITYWRVKGSLWIFLIMWLDSYQAKTTQVTRRFFYVRNFLHSCILRLVFFPDT